MGHGGRRVHCSSNHSNAAHTDKKEPTTKQQVVTRRADIGDFYDVAKHCRRNRQASKPGQRNAIK